jgi:hypothetical protein
MWRVIKEPKEAVAESYKGTPVQFKNCLLLNGKVVVRFSETKDDVDVKDLLGTNW